MSHIADHLAYWNRNDLNLSQINHLEWAFIEITNPIKSNIIVECIYRHSKIDLFEVIHSYLNPILDKLAKKQKAVFQKVWLFQFVNQIKWIKKTVVSCYISGRITLGTKLKILIFTLHLPHNLQSRVLVFQNIM